MSAVISVRTSLSAICNMWCHALVRKSIWWDWNCMRGNTINTFPYQLYFTQCWSVDLQYSSIDLFDVIGSYCIAYAMHCIALKFIFDLQLTREIWLCLDMTSESSVEMMEEHSGDWMCGVCDEVMHEKTPGIICLTCRNYVHLPPHVPNCSGLSRKQSSRRKGTFKCTKCKSKKTKKKCSRKDEETEETQSSSDEERVDNPLGAIHKGRPVKIGIFRPPSPV